MIYEIAEDIKQSVENKCDAYEIYIDEGKSIELDSLKEELNFAKEEIELGVGIRVIKDNKQGFAFTSNMDEIAKTSIKAIENTKLTKVDENYGFAEVEKVSDVKKVYDKKFNDLSLDDAVEFLKNTISTATDS
jgi:PmbA protein